MYETLSKYEALSYSSEIFVMCISEFYPCANVSKYIDTKMSLLVVFCTPVNSWNESLYCDSDVHIS